MEVSFSKEIESLRLGAGDTFHGEGILAITKALLQSGVAYVGGYQGAPVSHLLDVMVQAKDYMDELGVHVEACSNEASAAAMLGAVMGGILKRRMALALLGMATAGAGVSVLAPTFFFLRHHQLCGQRLELLFLPQPVRDVSDDYGKRSSLAHAQF